MDDIMHRYNKYCDKTACPDCVIGEECHELVMLGFKISQKIYKEKQEKA
jgi:hypothetical protein